MLISRFTVSKCRPLCCIGNSSYHSSVYLQMGRKSGASALDSKPRDFSRKQKLRKARLQESYLEKRDPAKEKARLNHLAKKATSPEMMKYMEKTSSLLEKTIGEILKPSGLDSSEMEKKTSLPQPNPMDVLKYLRKRTLSADPTDKENTEKRLIASIGATEKESAIVLPKSMIQYDNKAIESALIKLAKQGRTPLVEDMKALMKSQHIAISVNAYTSLMAAATKKGDTTTAERYFQEMIRDGLTPDTFAWTALIHAKTKTKVKSTQDNTGMNNTVAALLPSAAAATTRSLSKLQGGSEKSGSPTASGAEAAIVVLDRLKSNGVPLVAPMYNCILLALLNEKKQERVTELWNRMHTDGIALDKESFTIMMKHCAATGRVERAFFYLDEMRARGIEPDSTLFLSLFRACAEAPHWVNGYHDILYDAMAAMEGAELIPSTEIYNCIIYAFGRAGDAKAAEFYFWEMRKKGIHQDLMTYNSLLGALSRAQAVGGKSYGIQGRFARAPEREPTEEEAAYKTLGPERVAEIISDGLWSEVQPMKGKRTKGILNDIQDDPAVAEEFSRAVREEAMEVREQQERVREQRQKYTDQLAQAQAQAQLDASSDNRITSSINSGRRISNSSNGTDKWKQLSSSQHSGQKSYGSSQVGLVSDMNSQDEIEIDGDGDDVQLTEAEMAELNEMLGGETSVEELLASLMKEAVESEMTEETTKENSEVSSRRSRAGRRTGREGGRSGQERSSRSSGRIESSGTGYSNSVDGHENETDEGRKRASYSDAEFSSVKESTGQEQNTQGVGIRDGQRHEPGEIDARGTRGGSDRLGGQRLAQPTRRRSHRGLAEVDGIGNTSADRAEQRLAAKSDEAREEADLVARAMEAAGRARQRGDDRLLSTNAYDDFGGEGEFGDDDQERVDEAEEVEFKDPFTHLRQSTRKQRQAEAAVKNSVSKKGTALADLIDGTAPVMPLMNGHNGSSANPSDSSDADGDNFSDDFDRLLGLPEDRYTVANAEDDWEKVEFGRAPEPDYSVPLRLRQRENISRAALAFQDLTKKGLKPDSVTLTSLVATYAEALLVDDALETFKGFEEYKLRPTERTYRVLVRMYVRAKDIESALSVKTEMIEKKMMVPDSETYGLLIESLTHRDRIADSLKLLEEAAERSITIRERHLRVLRNRCKNLGVAHPNIPADPNQWVKDLKQVRARSKFSSNRRVQSLPGGQFTG